MGQMNTQPKQDNLLAFHDVIRPYLLEQHYLYAGITLTGLLILIGLLLCSKRHALLHDIRSSATLILVLDFMSLGCYLQAFFAIRGSWSYHWPESVYAILGWAGMTFFSSCILLRRLQTNYMRRVMSNTRLVKSEKPEDRTIWPPPPKDLE